MFDVRIWIQDNLKNCFAIAGSNHTVMRSYVSFILAVMLSLNAANAAVVGVCDALENKPGHTAHFLHHSHADSDDHTGKATPFGDHQHNHAHSGFSTILPNSIGLLPMTVGNTLVAAPAEIFVSAPQTLLDRPPRATLA
jgi:hypothetical protein